MPRTKRETYYEILGISRNATAEATTDLYVSQISFWEKLAVAGSSEAKEKILELTKAYLTLSDPKKRARYDAELDFDFVLLDGKAKDPEMEEAYDHYRLGHKKSYQEILSEFTKFRLEMGDTLWVLKKTTVYLVINLLVYAGIVLIQSLYQNQNNVTENDFTFNLFSLLFLGMSVLGYLMFRFYFLPKQLQKRKNQRT
ncbi:DnaJ-related protein [Leptospira biflexa serovar Patoc strain 'Patoc 1 (Ames)']|uniref:Putative chaperone protein DnaJ n=1 Tax=Leptospira biflexa serovar Patoc (strain Patoc 1 / ATCC 23582 / Paris) TaxID=456481 RepID=B0SS32_LEPBP|nr:DnaJ domain-containing protein [Leptospira biflexa]ABZ94270.1 DnaJ-related protein [Leptospira biflexa serovar Patoc strain 'Patoc 1 (Ames)']ABZ97922.1 Putative chaperone protein DnaJ [Leptospira biflexa serovar Patoc strain 'Patoc 1 (Paris)']